MANGHVEIHDPFASNNVTPSDDDPTSQTASMDDTVEFRLLMVYSQRRRPPAAPEREGPRQTDPPSTPTTGSDKEVKEEKKTKKKKRRGAKGMLGMFSCIKPSGQSDGPSEPASPSSEPEFRCGAIRTAETVASGDVEERDELDDVADVMTELASEIPFAPPDIEYDSPEDVNVEKVIALLLREAGDKLEQEMKDANIAAEFRNYTFFKRVMKTLLCRMGLLSSEADHLGPQASPKAQIAVTCEATSRLLTLTSTSFPQRRMLGYGAQYLRDYFSDWVTENGGYAKAFHSNDEEEVE